MALHRLAHAGKVTSILSADFATLFTMLPHQTIKYYIFRLVNLCYKSSGKRYIAVGYKVFTPMKLSLPNLSTMMKVR